MRSRAELAIFLLLFLGVAEAAPPKPKVSAAPPTFESALRGGNYLVTKRSLQAVVKESRPKDTKGAREWTRSLLALISLERLVGDEAEARRQFQRCDSRCAELVSQEEWESIRRWGCGTGKNQPAVCKSRKK